MPTPRVVVKRDGRCVDLDPLRLQGSLEAAWRAAGIPYGGLGGRGPRVVCERLLATLGPGELSTAAIRGRLEELLVEMGWREVARAYRERADQRERARRALRVLVSGEVPEGGEEGALLVPYDSARIVAGLMLESGLERSAALEIAAVVEKRVLAGGWSVVTTAFLEEVLRQERIERALPVDLRRNALIGLSRAELDGLVATGCSSWEGELVAWERPLEETVAAKVLERYGSAALLPPAAALAHRRGEVHFLHIEHPLRHLGAMLSIAPGELGAQASIERMAMLMREETSQLTVVLDLGDCGGDPGPFGAELRRVLPLWGALACASATPLRICLDWSSGGGDPPLDLLEALTVCILGSARDTAARAPGGMSGLEWCGPLAGRSGGRSVLALLERFPGVELRYHLARRISPARYVLRAQPHVRPGRGAPAVELGAWGGMALNLPRLARRAGLAREGGFFDGIRIQLELGRAACERLGALRAQRAAPRGGGAPLSGAAAFAVVPIGIVESLEILWGQLARRSAARLLTFLGEAVRRFGEEIGATWMLELSDHPQARRRFERLDESWVRGMHGADSSGVSAYPGRVVGEIRYGFGLQPARRGAHPRGDGSGSSLGGLAASTEYGVLHPREAKRSLQSG